MNLPTPPAPQGPTSYTYGGDRLFPVLKLVDVATPSLIMLAVSVCAALIPSFSAARQRPAASLRYV